MVDRIDILLKEYESCQSHNNALGNQSWISYSLVFSANAVLLAGVAYNLIPRGKYIEPALAFLPFGIGLIMVLFLFLCLKPWIKRVTFQIDVNHERMRKIEDELSLNGSIIMEKNWLIRGLDLKREYDRKENYDWCKLSDQRKNLIDSICTRYPLFPSYASSTRKLFIPSLFYLIIASWILLTSVAFILSWNNW